MASLRVTRGGHHPIGCHDPQRGKLRRVADGVRLQYHAPKQFRERCPALGHDARGAWAAFSADARHSV
jgi:hypothetical protein